LTPPAPELERSDLDEALRQKEVRMRVFAAWAVHRELMTLKKRGQPSTAASETRGGGFKETSSRSMAASLKLLT